MLKKMKNSVQKSQEHLENIVDKLDDEIEDLNEDARELWQEARPKIAELKDSLAKAAQALHTQTDEARLQAHLATMDAADQWHHLSEAMAQLAKHAQSKGQTELQHAQLQAHLAKMDARDFTKEKSQDIRRDFERARDKLEEAAHKTAESLERSFEIIGESLVAPYR